MSRLLRFTGLLFLCLPALAWGQQTAEPARPVLIPRSASQSVAQVSLEGRIKLDVVVTNKAGKPVTDLDAQDFTLLDNNKPQKIVTFQAFGGANAKPDPPTEVILLLDTVNDSFRNVSTARSQIQSFLQENGGHLAQPVSIMAFTDTGSEALGEASIDGNELAAKVGQFKSVLRNSGLGLGGNGDIERFNLSIKTISEILRSVKNKPGRKLLLWIGPGWPLLDDPSFRLTDESKKNDFNAIADFSTGLREGRIGVYSIALGQSNSDTMTYTAYLKGIKKPWQANAANLSVKVLSMQNGGRVLGPDNGLKSQIDSCVQDAAAFYMLSFEPPHSDQPDEYHDLKVVIGKPGLTAHTSTGYYNQP